MQPDGMARLSAAPPPAAATQIAKGGSQRDLVRKVDPTTAAGSVRRPTRHSAVRLTAEHRNGLGLCSTESCPALQILGSMQSVISNLQSVLRGGVASMRRALFR